MITPNDFKSGYLIKYKDSIWEVLSYQRIKNAQRRAFVRVKLRNLFTGAALEENFDSWTNFEQPDIERRRSQYSYHDGDDYHFMDLETYDQFSFNAETLGDRRYYLTENLELFIISLDGKPVTVEVPTFVDLKVAETGPDYTGDTATGGGKPATLETGLKVNVPFFIVQGETVRIDTRENSYVERVARERPTHNA
jgi:elongation factor P